MERILRVFGVGILVSLAVRVGALLQACSCLPPSPPLIAAEEVDLVFAGEVQSIEELEPGVPFSSLQVTFGVSELFVGERSMSEVQVQTASDGALCGFGFRVEESYLVYARENRDGFGTGLCDRTRALSRAEEDLEALRGRPDPLSLHVAPVTEGLQLTVIGGGGGSLLLEASSDLQDWESIDELRPDRSPFSVIRGLDSEVTQRFFRLRELPPSQGIYGLTIMLPGACLEDPERPGECLNLPFPGGGSYDVRAFSDTPDLGRGNPIVTSFQSRGEPSHVRVSDVHGSELDAGELSSDLRSALGAEGIELSTEALVRVQRVERTWVVHDPESQLVWFVEHEGNELVFVRTGSFRVPLPVGEYCVWSFFGCDRQISVAADEWQFQILQVALP